MERSKCILLIEDEADMRRMARAALESAGHRVIEADGVQVGLNIFRSQKPDLVILDIKLPDGDGLEACQSIRRHKALAATPVIMLTGRGQMDEKLLGFSAGADQYLVKPVPPQELLSWVSALLRRVAYDTSIGDELVAGDLVIDLKSHLVRFREEIIANLTGKEFDLLYYLVRKRPHVLSRKYILSNLWHTIAVDHVVDTHIGNLRRKLPREVSDRIQNVPGKGFRYFE